MRVEFLRACACVRLLMYFGKRSPLFWGAELFDAVLRKAIRQIVSADKK